MSTSFRAAVAVEPLGEDRFGAVLGSEWTVGPKAHGGLLLALLAQAALARLGAAAPGVAPDPLAVSADFLRAPDPGPVELRTELLRAGRTASVVGVRLEQDGRLMLVASVTAGRLPTEPPVWTDRRPEQPAEPPPDALDPATVDPFSGLARACELRWDPATVGFVRGRSGPPVVRGWVRPRGEPVDVLFALLAGDVLPPALFNLGGERGWAPTVQLTALLRAHPAPGWLHVESRVRSVAGGWFDEDATVLDATGRLVGQARQLALAPKLTSSP